VKKVVNLNVNVDACSLTRAELRVVLVMKLAEEEASVSGYETMEKES